MPSRSETCLPAGPYASALPSPPSSFESAHSTEQIDRPTRLKEHGISPEFRSLLHRKYNQIEFGIMNNARFDEIVLRSVEDRYARESYADEDIEAEVKRPMDEEISKLEEDVATFRPSMPLGIFKALPDDPALRFYFTCFLSVDNIYDIKAFLAYGVPSLLNLLRPKATESTKTSSIKTRGRLARSQATRKSNTKSARRANKSLSPDTISLASASKNSPRRSPRLVGRQSLYCDGRKIIKGT